MEKANEVQSSDFGRWRSWGMQCMIRVLTLQGMAACSNSLARQQVILHIPNLIPSLWSDYQINILSDACCNRGFLSICPYNSNEPTAVGVQHACSGYPDNEHAPDITPKLFNSKYACYYVQQGNTYYGSILDCSDLRIRGSSQAKFTCIPAELSRLYLVVLKFSLQALLKPSNYATQSSQWCQML